MLAPNRGTRCPPHKSWSAGITKHRLKNWKTGPFLPKKPNWAECFREDWTPGELGAHERLEAFESNVISKYPSDRDRPSIEATSRLSPHLAHGEITPFQIWGMRQDQRN